MHREEAREEEPVMVSLQDDKVVFREDSLRWEKQREIESFHVNLLQYAWRERRNRIRKEREEAREEEPVKVSL